MRMNYAAVLALAGTALAAGLSVPANAQQAIQGEGASTTIPTYNAEFSAFAGLDSHYAFTAYSTSSGSGQTAVTNNVGTNPGGVPAGEAVDFGVTASYVNSTFQTNWNAAATGLAEAGPFIQIPVLGIAIAVPFTDAKIKAGKNLALTDTDLCNIFSGAVTSWSGIPSAKAHGATAPFTVYYREDSSGASFLLTQHLAAVCPAGLGPDSVTFATTTSFAKLFAGYTTSGSNTFVPPSLTNFVAESGSSGIATALGAAAEGVAYLSPDYTAVNPNSDSGFTTLQAASVTNAKNGIAYQPTYQNTASGLQHPGAGSTNPKPPSTKNAGNQLLWVPAIPVTNSGYPIVGYDSWLIPQCFANTAVGSGLIEFLTDHYDGDFNTEINNNGFVAVQAAGYVKAIKTDFLSAAAKETLSIDNSKTCAKYPGRPDHSGS